MLEGSKAYTDPFSLGNNISNRLDVLLLLLDRVFVTEPTKENLGKWNYDQSRFFSLVQERMFVPVYIANDPIEVFGGENYLIRKNIVEDIEFNSIYDAWTEEDSKDRTFNRLARQACLIHETPLDVSFNLGWDLIISQMLVAPIVIGKRYENLLKYRIESSARDMIADNFRRDESTRDTVTKFLHRILNRLPSSLSIDDLKSFRRDGGARHFREWFRDAYSKAVETKKAIGIDIDEAMERDFNELVRQHSKRGSGISWAITGSVAITSALFAGPLAGVMSATGSAILPKAVTSFWKRYGSRNWTYLIIRMKN